MLGALLILAVLIGCAGAWRGNRTSMALLASAGLSSALIWLGTPFIEPVWMMIDMAVVAAVLTGPVKASDFLIVALFVPAWPLYSSVQQGDQQAGNLVNMIVAAQLLFSAPWRWALHKIHLRRADLKAEGDFLRVNHGAT